MLKKNLKKIIIGIAAFAFICVFALNNTYDQVVAKAESYNVEYVDCGPLVTLRSILILHNTNEEASEALYIEAESIYNNLITLGADPNDIPVVLYSDVTYEELALLRDYEELFSAANKADSGKSDTPITEMDSDEDGVLDEDDMCPDFDDAIDENANGIVDGCETDSDNDGVYDDLMFVQVLTML